MKHCYFALLVAAITFSGCSKKTTPAAAPPPSQTTAEKKPSTLDELKGKPVQAKELPADKKEDAIKSTEGVKNQMTESSYKTYYESGYQKHNSGDFSGAISDFSKSIELNPSYSDAYNFRGMSRYKSGDNQGACSDWKHAAELGNASAGELAQRYCH